MRRGKVEEEAGRLGEGREKKRQEDEAREGRRRNREMRLGKVEEEAGR